MGDGGETWKLEKWWWCRGGVTRYSWWRTLAGDGRVSPDSGERERYSFTDFSSPRVRLTHYNVGY